jgi:hypothetical protein
LARATADSKRKREQSIGLTIGGKRRAGRLAADGGRVRFIYGDANGREFRAVHARESEQVTAIVNDSDVHGNIYFRGAALGGGEYGAGAFES